MFDTSIRNWFSLGTNELLFGVLLPSFVVFIGCLWLTGNWQVAYYSAAFAFGAMIVWLRFATLERCEERRGKKGVPDVESF